MITRSPVFFIGHGSPMNAIETNDFTQTLAKMRALCPQPKAVLVVSAHWLIDGSQVTHMSAPKTIHDFLRFSVRTLDANVPVLQLSLDSRKSVDEHFQAGVALRTLRDEGVLIVASGNVVHNLRQVCFESSAPTLAWALEFDSWVKMQLDSRHFRALLNDFHESKAGQLSVPTPAHYLPLFLRPGCERRKR